MMEREQSIVLPTTDEELVQFAANALAKYPPPDGLSGHAEDNPATADATTNSKDDK